MPIYEYRCEQCGTFEQMQGITTPPLERCPTCRRKVRRLISSTSFQLKGSGWYVTDYARKGAGNGGGKADGGESKSEAKAEGKTEAKAAAKAETSPTPPSTSAKTGS